MKIRIIGTSREGNAAGCGPDCRAVKPETDHQVLSEIAGACDPWCDDGDVLDADGHPVEDGKPVPVAVRIEPGGPVTLTFTDRAHIAEWAAYIDWFNEPCAPPLARYDGTVGVSATGTWLGRPIALSCHSVEAVVVPRGTPTAADGGTWTEARIRGYGVRMPGTAAIAAVYGFGRTKAFEMLQSGEPLDFPVIRRGRNYVVPTAAVLAALGLAT